MTTIAANRACMASDSKVTHGDTSFHGDKLYRIGKVIVGACGDTGDIAAWLRWFSKGGTRKRFTVPEFASKKPDIDVLVLTPQGLFFSNESGHFEAIKEGFYAIGNGQVAALVAMDLGLDPATAIEAVCKRDNSTGGPVQVMSLTD